MPTVQKISPFNGMEYSVGVEKWFVSKQGADISTFDIIWPTYGKWAGPSWANNHRVGKYETINWDDSPCRNGNITEMIDPEKCYSLIDGATKQHDWSYELAEHNTAGQEDSIKMTADTKLLSDINYILAGNKTYT